MWNLPKRRNNTEVTSEQSIGLGVADFNKKNTSKYALYEVKRRNVSPTDVVWPLKTKAKLN